MNNLKNQSLHVMITEKQHEQLRLVAFSHKVSIGNIVRLLIDKYAEKLKPADKK
jgi:hypothetical protein